MASRACEHCFFHHITLTIDGLFRLVMGRSEPSLLRRHEERDAPVQWQSSFNLLAVLDVPFLEDY